MKIISELRYHNDSILRIKKKGTDIDEDMLPFLAHVIASTKLVNPTPVNQIFIFLNVDID
ncbi:MAG: hypothetical protein WBD99_01335 [Thermodesulfobacteriota bacterium]